MKWKGLLAVLLGLLMVGAMARNTSAYQGLGWNKYTTTVSRGGSNAQVNEEVFIYGAYPVIWAGESQTVVISSYTGINNEPLCHLSSGCFIPKNKRLEVYQVEGPTNVEYVLWWIGDNDGSGVPSKYRSVIEGAVTFMRDIIEDTIPYSNTIIDSVRLLTRHDYGHDNSWGLVLGSSFSRYIGDHITGGMVLWVHPTETTKLGSDDDNRYTYRIRVRSTTEIWFSQHSSWVFGKDKKETDMINPLDGFSYVRTVPVQDEYTLTVIVPKH